MARITKQEQQIINQGSSLEDIKARIDRKPLKPAPGLPPAVPVRPPPTGRPESGSRIWCEYPNDFLEFNDYIDGYNYCVCNCLDELNIGISCSGNYMTTPPALLQCQDNQDCNPYWSSDTNVCTNGTCTGDDWGKECDENGNCLSPPNAMGGTNDTGETCIDGTCVWQHSEYLDVLGYSTFNNYYPGLVGDINFDGLINIRDIIISVSGIVNEDLTECEKWILDTNRDGEINVADIVNMKKHIFGEHGTDCKGIINGNATFYPIGYEMNPNDCNQLQGDEDTPDWYICYDVSLWDSDNNFHDTFSSALVDGGPYIYNSLGQLINNTMIDGQPNGNGFVVTSFRGINNPVSYKNISMYGDDIIGGYCCEEGTILDECGVCGGNGPITCPNGFETCNAWDCMGRTGKGDSGGPLFIINPDTDCEPRYINGNWDATCHSEDYELVGVTAWSAVPQLAQEGAPGGEIEGGNRVQRDVDSSYIGGPLGVQPGIFTRIWPYKSWIEDIIQDDNDCWSITHASACDDAQCNWHLNITNAPSGNGGACISTMLSEYVQPWAPIDTTPLESPSDGDSHEYYVDEYINRRNEITLNNIINNGEIESNRIQHGEEVFPVHKYPFVVGLLNGNDDPPPAESGVCGGSIIDDMWVITAAHCLVSDGRKKPGIGFTKVTNIAEMVNDDGIPIWPTRVATGGHYRQHYATNTTWPDTILHSIEWIITPMTTHVGHGICNSIENEVDCDNYIGWLFDDSDHCSWDNGICHGSSSTGWSSDIALIKLRSPISTVDTAETTPIRWDTIPLQSDSKYSWEGTDHKGSGVAITSGWGRTESGQPSDVLMEKYLGIENDWGLTSYIDGYSINPSTGQLQSLNPSDGIKHDTTTMMAAGDSFCRGGNCGKDKWPACSCEPGCVNGNVEYGTQCCPDYFKMYTMKQLAFVDTYIPWIIKDSSHWGGSSSLDNWLGCDPHNLYSEDITFTNSLIDFCNNTPPDENIWGFSEWPWVDRTSCPQTCGDENAVNYNPSEADDPYFINVNKKCVYAGCNIFPWGDPNEINPYNTLFYSCPGDNECNKYQCAYGEGYDASGNCVGVVDDCGICGGNNLYVDECGVCFGYNKCEVPPIECGEGEIGDCNFGRCVFNQGMYACYGGINNDRACNPENNLVPGSTDSVNDMSNIIDCPGYCVPESWLGDGVCQANPEYVSNWNYDTGEDDGYYIGGTEYPEGSGIYPSLYCELHNFEGGDCLDEDDDGIPDSIDDCVGEWDINDMCCELPSVIDECGICGGEGDIYECGCFDECDCGDGSESCECCDWVDEDEDDVHDSVDDCVNGIGPDGEPCSCQEHSDCVNGYFCHSGWNGSEYGNQICVEYHNQFCKNSCSTIGDYGTVGDGSEICNPYGLRCGIGDGDCEQNWNDCDDGVCGFDDCDSDFYDQGITGTADCCKPYLSIPPTGYKKYAYLIIGGNTCHGYGAPCYEQYIGWTFEGLNEVHHQDWCIDYWSDSMDNCETIDDCNADIFKCNELYTGCGASDNSTDIYDCATKINLGELGVDIPIGEYPFRGCHSLLKNWGMGSSGGVGYPDDYLAEIWVCEEMYEGACDVSDSNNQEEIFLNSLWSKTTEFAVAQTSNHSPCRQKDIEVYTHGPHAEVDIRFENDGVNPNCPFCWAGSATMVYGCDCFYNNYNWDESNPNLCPDGQQCDGCNCGVSGGCTLTCDDGSEPYDCDLSNCTDDLGGDDEEEEVGYCNDDWATNYLEDGDCNYNGACDIGTQMSKWYCNEHFCGGYGQNCGDYDDNYYWYTGPGTPNGVLGINDDLAGNIDCYCPCVDCDSTIQADAICIDNWYNGTGWLGDYECDGIFNCEAFDFDCGSCQDISCVHEDSGCYYGTTNHHNVLEYC